MTITPAYRETMRLEHANNKFGTTGQKYGGKDIVALLAKREYIRTVLDFGAGKGSLGRYIESTGWDGKWVNYDPGIPEYDVLPECQYDLVVTTDVLEHIEPELLPEVLRTLAKLTRTVLYSNIACVDTGKHFAEGEFAGQDLHMIVEKPVWWRQQFKQNCALTEFYYCHEEYPQRGRPTTRCQMIHERS